MSTCARWIAGALACTLLACSPEPEPRGQVLVHVDMDLPVTGQVAERLELADAALDSLRIDVLSEDGVPGPTFLVVAPDARDWPISFGVAKNGETERVRVRLRAFRASRAKSGYVGDTTTLDPRGDVSIDRLIEVSLPDSGVDDVRVLLHGACLGIPADLVSRESCIDDPTARSAASVGVEAGAPPASRVGTSELVVAKPCVGTPPLDSACIPGGFSLMGEDDLDGLAGDAVTLFDSGPVRPVTLTPYFLDRTEYTVGRLRALLAANPNALTNPMPYGVSHHARCTWDPASPDDLPLNCLHWTTARELCQKDGGDLPSEARWEHAARGRGRGNAFPWGSALAECCTARIVGGVCPIDSAGPVGEHAALECPTHDVSVDGVLDLGGNVREFTLDVPSAYDDGFWAGSGVFHDPVSPEDGTFAVTRGGSFNDAFPAARSAFRRMFSRHGPASSLGFRCAYEDAGQ